MNSRIAIALFAGALWACSHSTPEPSAPPSPPDATDAAGSPPCVQACARLTLLGCPEGKGADCSAVLGRIESDHLVRTSDGTPQTCAAVAAAQNTDAERGLGVACKQ